MKERFLICGPTPDIAKSNGERFLDIAYGKKIVVDGRKEALDYASKQLGRLSEMSRYLAVNFLEYPQMDLRTGLSLRTDHDVKDSKEITIFKLDNK